MNIKDIARFLYREMMIVFVYDTEICQDEADDPVKAVLYFHPSWVSDSQKLSLCGQLMGTAQFLRQSFSKPKIISLQNGKFVLKEFGRFVLVVGTILKFYNFQMRFSFVTFLHIFLLRIGSKFVFINFGTSSGSVIFNG